jgi:hypothetical protein
LDKKYQEAGEDAKAELLTAVGFGHGRLQDQGMQAAIRVLQVILQLRGGHFGSQIDMIIEVIPALQPRGVRQNRLEYMGKSTTSIAYAAELRGIELAFQIALDIHAVTSTPGTRAVFTDNQAAV